MAASSEPMLPLRGSRFIASEHIGAVTPWQFASVAPQGDDNGGIIDPQALREAHEQGRVEGFAAGHAQAWAEAQARIDKFMANQAQEATQRLAGVFAAADAGLADAQQDIARGTLEIACAVARQVVRSELQVNREALEPVIRDALALLLADAKAATVRLCPGDIELLGESLLAELAAQSVTVVPDAAVAPGDCLVESGGATVDGGVASRWSRAVASLGLSVPWNAEPDETDDAAR